MQFPPSKLQTPNNIAFRGVGVVMGTDDTEVFAALGRAQISLPELDGSSEALLREHFPALASTFLAYARSDSVGSPPLLARAGLEKMLHDCRMQRFTPKRVVDAVWARPAAGAPTEPPLDMSRFLEALVLFSRETKAATTAAATTAVTVSKRPSSSGSVTLESPSESERLQALLRPLLAHTTVGGRLSGWTPSACTCACTCACARASARASAHASARASARARARARACTCACTCEGGCVGRPDVQGHWERCWCSLLPKLTTLPDYPSCLSQPTRTLARTLAPTLALTPALTL